MLFSVLQVCLWIRTLRVIVISPEQPSCPYGTLYLLTLNTADTSLTFPVFFYFLFLAPLSLYYTNDFQGKAHICLKHNMSQ